VDVSSDININGINFTNSGPVNMIPGGAGPSVYRLQMTLSASNTAILGEASFGVGLNGAKPITITNSVSIVALPSVVQTPDSRLLDKTLPTLHARIID